MSTTFKVCISKQTNKRNCSPLPSFCPDSLLTKRWQHLTRHSLVTTPVEWSLHFNFHVHCYCWYYMYIDALWNLLTTVTTKIKFQKRLWRLITQMMVYSTRIPLWGNTQQSSCGDSAEQSSSVIGEPKHFFPVASRLSWLWITLGTEGKTLWTHRLNPIWGNEKGH